MLKNLYFVNRKLSFPAEDKENEPTFTDFRKIEMDYQWESKEWKKNQLIEWLKQKSYWICISEILQIGDIDWPK